LLQASQFDYSSEAVGGQELVICYYRYLVSLSLFSAAYRELVSRVTYLDRQLLKESERDPFYIVSYYLFSISSKVNSPLKTLKSPLKMSLLCSHSHGLIEIDENMLLILLWFSYH
jgi:hypothetical protein